MLVISEHVYVSLASFGSFPLADALRWRLELLKSIHALGSSARPFALVDSYLFDDPIL